MIQLIYVSAAVSEMREDALRELLRTSRENNATLGVTGMLLYRRGDFMQALEGEERTVRKLLRRIARDPRHHGLVTLMARPISARAFGDWKMGFRSLVPAALERSEGFSSVLNQRFHQAPTPAPDLALKLLLRFAGQDF